MALILEEGWEQLLQYGIYKLYSSRIGQWLQLGVQLPPESATNCQHDMANHTVLHQDGNLSPQEGRGGQSGLKSGPNKHTSLQDSTYAQMASHRGLSECIASGTHVTANVHFHHLGMLLKYIPSRSTARLCKVASCRQNPCLPLWCGPTPHVHEDLLRDSQQQLVAHKWPTQDLCQKQQINVAVQQPTQDLCQKQQINVAVQQPLPRKRHVGQPWPAPWGRPERIPPGSHHLYSEP